MIYVMSDLHGCYEEYIKMLNLINFSDNDTLYILGDICDRGEHPMKILLHMMEHENIIPIYGNHDVKALYFLPKIKGYAKDVLNDYGFALENLMGYEDYRDMCYWLTDGGRKTLKDFASLSNNDKKRVIEYLYDFNWYKNVIINNNEFILVHGGLSPFNKDKPLDSYMPYDLIWTRPNIEEKYYDDKYVVFGHTPTELYDSNMAGKIIIKNNNIDIDCGCVFNLSLGCLCLDTFEEYYVKKEKIK